MLKKISSFLVAIYCLAASHAHALPIQEADAFQNGDNKAFHQASTNMDWLDLNKGNSEPLYNNLISSEWRAPSTNEVYKLLGEIFTRVWTDNTYVHLNRVIFGAPRNAPSPYPEISQMFDIMGNVAAGFTDENGTLKRVSLIQTSIYYPAPPSPNGEKWSDYVETEIHAYISIEDGTRGPRVANSILVRNVPEPSAIFLLLIGLATFGWKRKYSKRFLAI